MSTKCKVKYNTYTYYNVIEDSRLRSRVHWPAPSGEWY